MKSKNCALLIYSTIPDEHQAKALGQKALELKLAACVNVTSKIDSLYLWVWKIQNSKEYIVMFKTLQNKKDSLFQLIKDLHPYQLPAIISFEIQTTDNFYEYLKENLLWGLEDKDFLVYTPSIIAIVKSY